MHRLASLFLSVGKQASLAADFSINQFSYLSRLLLVHGRNSYKRSAALSQFVMHRGLIISVMQAIFSSIFYFASISLYQGFLLVGYGTVYTMFPVFSLVLDKDVRSEIALLYPELYKELSKGRSLSFKTFFLWVFISIYQGGAIMYGSFLLFDDDFIHVVSITFTSLILTELLMVALTVGISSTGRSFTLSLLWIDSNLASVDDSCSTAEFGLLCSLLDCSQIALRSWVSSIVGLHLACSSGDIDLLFATLRPEVRASEM